VASTRAEDGMSISLARTFESRTEHDLPSQVELERQIKLLAGQLDALRTAPTAEPYNGPALLSGRAAAVFFHEVLGHRLEGQRQRGTQEGETFTKEVGNLILPAFISVADDPTLSTLNGTYLSGYYAYDDEGQPAQKVELVQNGILKQFLMSRIPIANFDISNGHGRAQDGRMPTGRQGNLIVTSAKTTPEKKLRQLLLDEIKKENKPYGLYFEDIASGYTLTQRVTPQAFQVIPQLVYRVYADGRPDELVRGVQIVGTPQASLTHILATGDKQDIFNGECGAESGSIPVSAIAPAMLFSSIETQKAPQGKVRPPILPSPDADSTPEAQ
jgi:predicted Zn-dependent protease